VAKGIFALDVTNPDRLNCYGKKGRRWTLVAVKLGL